MTSVASQPGRRVDAPPVPPPVPADPAGAPGVITSSSGARAGHRLDIGGLRAVAVLAVVLFHAGVPGLDGGYVGVDVFFVISGFLITSQLLRGIDGPQRISLADFYARRARRLLPAALVVLTATVLVGLLCLPPLQWRDLLADAGAAAAYVPNVLFALHGVDYLAEATPSLFQHYWSLGVEEQFYLLWPLVLILLSRWARGRTRLMLVTGLVVVSFTAGMVLSWVRQPYAFFLLPTRAWELGVGALVALIVLAARRSGRRLLVGPPAALVGWLGLALIVGAVLSFDGSTLFPGYAAALPVMGAALLILADTDGVRGGPVALLGRRAPQFIGVVSYSLYLVHWPLLVLPQATVGYLHPLSLPVRIGLAAAGLPLAWALWRYVERPGQQVPWLTSARPHRSLLLAGGSTVLILALLAGLAAVTSRWPLDAGRVATGLALDPSRPTSFVPANLTPSLRAASQDVPEVYANGCHLDFAATEPDGCPTGPAGAPGIVLFGDSHAAQWYPAVRKIADRHGYRLESHTKGSCPSVSVRARRAGQVYAACQAWRRAVFDRIAAERPALVVLANFAAPAGAGPGSDADRAEAWRQGLRQTVDQLPADTRVVVLADTPHLGQTPSICLSAHLQDTASCSRPRAAALNSPVRAAERAAAADAGVPWLDLTDEICGPADCSPVLGATLVYRDAHHLTATFAGLLTERLERDLRPWLP